MGGWFGNFCVPCCKVLCEEISSTSLNVMRHAQDVFVARLDLPQHGKCS